MQYRAGGISWYRKCRYPSSDSYDYNYTIGKVCNPWVCRASKYVHIMWPDKITIIIVS